MQRNITIENNIFNKSFSAIVIRNGNLENIAISNNTITESYNHSIDLEKEYPKVLGEIDKRRQKGEFNHV